METSNQSSTKPPDPSLGSLRRTGSNSHQKHPSNSSMNSYQSHGSIARITSTGTLPSMYTLSPMSGNLNGLEELDEGALSFFLNSGTPDGLSQSNISPGLSYFSGVSPLSFPATTFPPSGNGLNEFQQILPPMQEEESGNGNPKAIASLNYPATPATQYYSARPSKFSNSCASSVGPGEAAHNQVFVGRSDDLMSSTINKFGRTSHDEFGEQVSIQQIFTSPIGPTNQEGQMLPPPPRQPLNNTTDNIDSLSRSFNVLGHQQHSNDATLGTPTHIQQQKNHQNHNNGNLLQQPDMNHLNWIKHLNATVEQARRSKLPSTEKLCSTEQRQIDTNQDQPCHVPQFHQFVQKRRSHAKSNPEHITHYSTGAKGPTQYLVSQSQLQGLRTPYIHNVSPSLSAQANAPVPDYQTTQVACGTTGSERNFPQVTATESEGSVAPVPLESDERRARRLARNRESARQSRRRKKENLSFLGDKVNNLHGEIEVLRRNKINSMEQALVLDEKIRIEELLKRSSLVDANISASAREALEKALQESHLDMMLRREVACFQNRTMRRQLLPYYQQFLLWNTCQSEKFFTAAKEAKPKSSGRMSSKQIGEEITNNERSANKPITTRSDELTRFWPLLCYELQFSADQEDRFKSAHTSILSIEEKSLFMDKARVAAALALTIRLKEGIQGYYDTLSNNRKQILLSVLKPEQTILYLKWLTENQSRCMALPSLQEKPRTLGRMEKATLTDLCAQLEYLLKIQEKRKT